MSERRLDGGCFSRKEKTVRTEIVMPFRIKTKHLQNLILSIFFLEAVNMKYKSFSVILANALLPFHNFLGWLKIFALFSHVENDSQF